MSNREGICFWELANENGIKNHEVCCCHSCIVQQ